MTGRLKPKHQRLVLILVAVAALIGATLLAMIALRGQANYFYMPADIAANPPAPGQAIRLGGMVETGSMQMQADGVTVQFVVSGDGERVQAVYTGIKPDLFVEGSGVVADGRMNAQGVFVADTLLAKHDENYMPRELEDMSRDEMRAELQDSVE